MTLPGDRVVRFGYDNNGNLTSLTPPGRAAHTMTHTPVDNLSEYTPPGTDGTLQYAYNRDRQLTSITRSDGKTITYAYHPTTARLESIGDGTTTFGLTYDEAGRVKTVSSPGAGLEYWYDGGLLTGSVWSGPISAWIDFEYDNDLRLARELVNDVPVTFGYDNDGVLTTVGALTITPDPANGRPTGTRVGTVTESIAYESTGEQRTSVITVSGIDRLTLATTARDNLGRAITESETFNGVTNTTTYGYDPEGRVQTVHRNGTLAATYGYDANGNRTSVTKNGQTTSATYDASQDRLLTYGSESYTYTPNGELGTKTNATGTTTYTYDSFGNLRTVALPDGRTIEYVIDGQSRRVGKKVNGILQRGWLYSDQLRVAAELDGAGQVVSRFIYGTRSNVPDLMIKSGITYRILSDRRGSPVVVVDTSSGETIQYRSYDEFGNLTADTNQGLHPFGFAGGLYDGDTGLTRFGARDYDPGTGRWTAKDPIMFAGGDTNLYGYVLSDPINGIDPTGLLVYGTYDNSSGVLTIRDADTGQSVTTFAESGGKPFGAPVPPGTYEILERAGRADFFRLDKIDESVRDDIDQATGRTHFRLHKPGRTIGCIAAKDAGGWEQVKTLINGTRTTTVPDFAHPWWKFWATPEPITRYGFITVK